MRLPSVDVIATRLFVGALFASAPACSLVEVRVRHGGGMRQSFHRVEALAELVAEIACSAISADVFVGVVPRARRAGGRRDLVKLASVLWVDCDTRAAVAALRTFRPQPSIMVASGGVWGRHAYWLLREPVAVEDVERANRRLAWGLTADLASSEPARILRPAGSMWHKSSPPVAVRLLQIDDVRRHELDEIVGRLDDAPVARRIAEPPRRAGSVEDPLLAIAPAVYVERLTGEVVGRGGKVRCPFHQDRTPSLHVYTEPERGWYCFGCRQGGSVYDLAALLWRTGTHGHRFVELRERLIAQLLPPRTVSHSERSWTRSFPRDNLLDPDGWIGRDCRI